MESDGNAGSSLPTLHDDFMQTLHDTGMYNYAQDIDLIQDGQLQDVRMHEELRMWQPEQGQEAGGPTEEEVREGEARMSAACAAAERAVIASEQVRQRLRDAAAAEAGEDALQQTPSKPRKARKGRGGGGGDGGGRGGSKGLRHFSMKVCEKVEGKGRTTYNEVADELVTELPGAHDPGSPGGLQFDEKNIRRRVYDALNVLMAMGIISREKKEISWQGLPQGPALSLDRLRAERQKRLQRLDLQRKYIADLVQQQATYRALIRRNQARAREHPAAAAQAAMTALPLPFVLIQVDRNATVEIKISEDNRQAHFDFEGMPFSFTGDEQVLQEMGLADARDPLAARALAAAAPADAQPSPRPAAAPHAHPTAPGSASRAHPGPAPHPHLLGSPPGSGGSHPGQLGALPAASQPPGVLSPQGAQPHLGQLPPLAMLQQAGAAPLSPQLLPPATAAPVFPPFAWQGLPQQQQQQAGAPHSQGLPFQPQGRWQGF